MRCLPLILIVAASVFQRVLAGETAADTIRTEEIPGAEELFDQIETEADSYELLDRLQWQSAHPYDLNVITREELESLPGMTPDEAGAVLGLRDSLGRFTFVEQLLLIGTIGEAIHQKISSYVTVVDPLTSKPPAFTLRNRVTRDLQQRRGYEDERFLGSPLKSYNRVSMSGGIFEAGALWEKDAGERASDGFSSGYLRARNALLFSDVIVGDFIVESGQGLVLWRATALGKGGEAVSVAKKSSLGPQPYRSADEFNFLRGVAATSAIETSFGELSVSAFISQRALSGTTAEGETLSSLYRDGYFRTESELTKRNAVTERLFGSLVRLRASDDFSIGLSGYRSTFDKAIAPKDPSSFSGGDKAIAGINADGSVGNVFLFGELARDDHGSGAGMAGAIFGFRPKATVTIVYRDYSAGFHNLHANGFGERGETNNERGMYFGFQLTPAKGLRLTGYLDAFRFPMRTFSSPLPFSGREFMLQAEHGSPGKLLLTARVAMKEVETNESAAISAPQDNKSTLDRLQRKARLTASYALSSRTRIRGRVDVTQVKYSKSDHKESGILLYQEIQTKPTDDLKLEGRLTFFDTGSYDSRVYAYENDLRGVFANPALYGKGRRWYLLVSWRMMDMLQISAKYSETLKEGVSSVGSGLSEIAGELDNRASVQIEMTF